MTEKQYLDRQEALALARIRGALDIEPGEPPVAFVERMTREHPWLAVGGAVAVGGAAAVLLARMPSKTLPWIAKTVWKQTRKHV